MDAGQYDSFLFSKPTSDGNECLRSGRESRAHARHLPGGQFTGITFDASGRQTQITFQAHGLIGPSYTVTQSSSYDGDGVLVREVRTQSNSPGSEQTTRYLRSSVLGGAVIEELNSSGEKIVGYVHTPSGRRFAVQRDGLVYFKHETPEGATELRTYSNNWAPGRVEFDPLGADVALTAPIDPPPDLGPGDLGDGRFGGILDARWGDFFNLSSGCPGGSQAASCSGHMYGRNMDREMRAFFGYRAHDFAGYSNPLMQGEHRYRSVFLNDGYDPEVGRYVRGYLAENGFADLENNTVWIFGGAEYFKVPQNPASLAPNGLKSNRRLSDAECDDYLVRIFGGRDARVGSTRDPDTLLQNAGTPRPPGHGPAPFNNPNPNSSDRGGIIHIYGNPQGTATDAALYAPSGGRMGPLYTHEDEYGDPDYTGRRVTYRTGLTISFVHVAASRGPGRSGSVRVGNIGGLGGEKPPGYIHTHIIFYSDFKNRVRVDPRKVFCGQ